MCGGKDVSMLVQLQVLLHLQKRFVRPQRCLNNDSGISSLQLQESMMDFALGLL